MFHRRISPFLFAFLLLCGSAAAQGLWGDNPEKAEARLIAGWEEPDGRRIAALSVTLDPGWKTYWRLPGDAGIPPQFDWTGSTNLAEVKIAWPTPTVFDTYGSQTIGYKDRMVLPLQITPADPAQPVSLRLALFYGICDDICIPARAELALDIPPGAAREGAAAIRTALKATPLAAETVGLTAASCRIEGDDKHRTLTARLSFAHPWREPPVMVAEGPEGVWFGPVETRLEDGDVIATSPIRTEAGAWIDRGALRLTILGGVRGVEVNGCAAAG